MIDLMAYNFTAETVIALVGGAWAAGLALGAVGALLASLVARRR